MEVPNKYKKTLVSLLFEGMVSDSEAAEKEMAYILKVCDVLELSEAEIVDIQNNRSAYEFPSDEKGRMTILYYLMFLMKADGKLTEEEIKLIKEYGFKLGFRSTMTDEMIIIIKEHIDKKLPPEALVDTIKKYHN